MRFTVRHQGVPVGVVDLVGQELSAGSMEPAPGYAAIQPIVRAGSTALLHLGFFGAATLGSTDNADVDRLHAAAGLRFELVDDDGRDIAATFVNLIEAPGDERVVVLARFGHAPAAVGARRRPAAAAAPTAARPDATLDER